MFKSSNPAFNPQAFNQTRTLGAGEAMTIQGTINKALISLFLLVIPAAWVWGKFLQPASMFAEAEVAQPVAAGIAPLFIGSFIGSIIAWLVTMFKKEWSPVTVPIYSVCEGVLIGAISVMFEKAYPGIVLQAVGLTFGVLFCMLMAYKSGLVTVTQKFRLGVTAALGAVCLVYLVNLVMSFFGSGIPLIYSNSPFGIGFSLVVVMLAAVSLVLDFDFIEQAARMGVPKYMEWYAAFGLMVGLIWLYLELLRLLSKLNSRR